MIVTHMRPDWDAITSVWLLKRYGGLESADIVFVNTGSPDPETLRAALAVVDTGQVYDPARLRFDHHQLPGGEANQTCATMQVYEWLIQAGVEIGYLYPLIELMTAGDTGRSAHGADWSRLIGIHAILSAWKQERMADVYLLEEGFKILDLLAEHLRQRVVAISSLEVATVYCSSDGRVVALRDAPPMATQAASENGAVIVLFQSSTEVEGGVTHAVGMMRVGEATTPHLGQVVEGLIASSAVSVDISAELRTWYRHPAGFFAGRGTAKAPVFEPVTIDLRELASFLSSYWRR